MTSDLASIEMFRDSAAGYLGAADQRQRMRALEARGADADRSVWSQLAELGWLSILVPEAAGGLGLGIAEVAALAEEAGRHLLPEPFVEAGVRPMALLARLPAGGLRDDLLAQAQAGTLLIGVASQERSGEIEPGPGRTRATVQGEAARLTGEKRFVRPAEGADGWIVLAGDAAQAPVLAWVDREAVARCETAFAVDGAPIATLHFQDTPARLLMQGEAALRALREADDLARIAQAAELLGVARRALELTLDYVRTRSQFGQPIGSFQALQHALVDGAIQVELAQSCLREVLDLVAQAPARLPLLASRAKARCAQVAMDVTRLAIQLHGAIGTTNEYDVGLFFKRAVTAGGRLGNAAAHRRRYAALAASAGPAAHEQATAVGTEFPRDADWDAVPEAQFRQMVRGFLEAHYPPGRRHLHYKQNWQDSREWHLTLSRQGWLAPAWPKQHGGMGLSPARLIAFIEECEHFGVARGPDQGVTMVGPILMRFGSEAQKAHYLPRILSGEHVWCQGYSEPNAGSDLAALRTEAVLDGDHFVVNGQKIWTTWGADATHIFMLVRTDKTVKKQAGISFLLADMRSPGITVRPIRNIAGESEFCEVFLDNVRVPRGNLVGELNQGWTIAKALLGFERLFTGSPKTARHVLSMVETVARQSGLSDDPIFAARLAQLQLDVADLSASYTGFADLVKRGEPVPATISMLKVWSTETVERLSLLLLDAAGDHGTLRDHACTDEIDAHVVAPLFNVLGAKIFAGSNEIQRNILAKQVLGLPS